MTPGLQTTKEFIDLVNQIILFPLIYLLTGIAILVFLYGCFIYIARSNDSSAHEEGRKHIMWGIIGLFIMMIAYTILSIAAGTFGLSDNLDCYDDPSLPGCDFIFQPYEGVGGGNTGGAGGGNTGGVGGDNTGGASGGN